VLALARVWSRAVRGLRLIGDLHLSQSTYTATLGLPTSLSTSLRTVLPASLPTEAGLPRSKPKREKGTHGVLSGGDVRSKAVWRGGKKC